MPLFVLLVVLLLKILLAASLDIYNVTMPSSIKALRGSCVQIPCTFNVPGFTNKLKNTADIFGSWLKHTHNEPSKSLIFNSSNTIAGGFRHIEMPGNLSRCDCTTVFYNATTNFTDVYYFRLEMEPNIFRATFINSSVNIVVMDVPDPPELSDVQEVIEGTVVNLTCSAENHCPEHPPKLFWSNMSSSTNITTWIEETPNKTQSVVSKMSFIASYMVHRQNISCTVTYPRNFSNATTVESSKMIQVLFSPKETHIFTKPSTSVSVGTNVTLTCKSKANPSDGMNFTWYKRGDQKHLPSGEQLTLSACRSDEGWYSCRAENKHGNQTAEEIQLIVKDVADPPELNGVQEVMEGTMVNLTCSAEVFCPKEPPTLFWSNMSSSTNITTWIEETPNKTQSVVSKMSFIASYMVHRQNISCTVTYSGNFSNATTVESSKMIQVLFSPKETHIFTKPSTSVSVGTNVTLTCKSKANPSDGMNFTWYKRGDQKHLPSGEQLTLSAYRRDEGWYSCRAENKHGNQTAEEILLIVKEPLASSVPLIAGCAGGIVAFLFLFIVVMIFTRCRKQRTQPSNEPIVGEVDISDLEQKTHVLSDCTYTNSAFVSNKQPETSNNESDVIHYGEINFSTLQAKPITDKNSGHEDQETVYSEVCNKKINQD